MPLPAPRRREPQVRVGAQNQNDAGVRSTDRRRLAQDATLPTGSPAAREGLSPSRFPDHRSGRHPRLRPAGPAIPDGQTTSGSPMQPMSRCPRKKMANDAAGNMPRRPHRKSGGDQASRQGAKPAKTIPTRRIFSVRARGRSRQNLAHGALPGGAVTDFSVFWRTGGFSSGQTLMLPRARSRWLRAPARCTGPTEGRALAVRSRLHGCRFAQKVDG